MPEKNDMQYRALSLRLSKEGLPSSLDIKSRSVECVMATEAPVPMYDWSKGRTIPEILLMSGVQIPASCQVPLLDTHSRYSTSSVIGSTRKIRVDGSQLIGLDKFSSVPEAEGPWVKTKEGHLTDRSVGYSYTNEDAVYVDDEETAVIDGRSFVGPAKVVKKWTVKENSICPIGADTNAKARADKPGKEIDMPSEATKETHTREERERVLEIQAMCRHFTLDKMAPGMIDNGTSITEARKLVMDAHIEAENREPAPSFLPSRESSYEVGRTGEEKRNDAIVDGLTLRSGIALENPAPGANEYRVTSLVDIARECLAAKGERVHGVGASTIVKRAIGHGTSDFPGLLANTANKVLRESYGLAPSSYEKWCHITDAKDFKEMSRNAISEAPDLDQVLELGEYKYGTFGESKEVFQVAKYGKMFSVSREAIINDDLAAFTSIPRAFALSARRKVNHSAYSVLVGNAAMSDGKALFHADHGNYIASGAGAGVGIATLSAGRAAMRLQTGLQGAILNITPNFLIVPAALETESDQILNTIEGVDDTSNKRNPFYRKFELIVEPVLDGFSSTAWYLAARPGQIDTVEVAFLEGMRTPYLESRDGWNVDGVEYKVRIEFGTKAIDWRGLYMNAGI